MKEEFEKQPHFETAEELDSFFTNKTAIFNGKIDLESMFSPVEQDNGIFDYSDEDKAQMEVYKEHEGMECRIVGGAIIDTFIPQATNKENFEYCYWDIEFEDGTYLNAVEGTALDFTEELTEAVKFSKVVPEEDELVPLDTEDLLMGHIYLDRGDEDLVPTFVDVNTLVHAFGLNYDDILNIAKEHKCKLWNVQYGSKSKMIVAAKEIKEEDIEEAYKEIVPFGQILTIKKAG